MQRFGEKGFSCEGGATGKHHSLFIEKVGKLSHGLVSRYENLISIRIMWVDLV